MACAFCIIPKVRGSSASVPPADVLARVGDLVRQGFREIVLTGIHLCSYGRDLAPPSSLLDLLRAIDGLPGDVSPAPELARPPASAARAARTFDGLAPRLSSFSSVPAARLGPGPQGHGPDEHRRPVRENPRVFFGRGLRRPGSAPISSSVSRGRRPTTFELSKDFLEKAPLSYLHVFPYSPRPGTPASTAKAVDGRAAKSRAARLRALSSAKNLMFRERFLGMVIEAVVIRTSVAGARVLTPNYIDVRVPPTGAKEGSSIKTVITRVTERGTSGEIVNEDGR